MKEYDITVGLLVQSKQVVCAENEKEAREKAKEIAKRRLKIEDSSFIGTNVESEKEVEPKKFRVSALKQVTYSTEVVVEAFDEHEAKEMAIDFLERRPEFGDIGDWEISDEDYPTITVFPGDEDES